MASLVIGVVWAFWHVPKFLTAGSTQDYRFWLFLLGVVANAIIYTWVFNSTGGSLLSVLLLHAAFNTSAISLPVLPAVTGDSSVLVITLVLRCVIAVGVVVIAGPARLTRSPHPA